MASGRLFSANLPSVLSQDRLILQTRARFPAPAEGDISITPIEKGGSERKFYRVQLGGQSLILVKYNDQRDENRHYVRIAEVLDALGVRTPKIFFHDDSEGLIWMEDLGEQDLWSFRQDPWSVRRTCYQSALEEIWRLHDRGWDGLARFPFTLQIEFNAALYRWEQRYFFDNCIGRYFENLHTPELVAEVAGLPVWSEIAEKLSAWPRVLVHRDFQSQNVLMHNGHAHLIDFQGLRPGLAHYDLASLLYDPYVQLVPAERAELLEFYLGLGRRHDLGASPGEFETIYRLCAVQRLMQALGAYGYLGLVKERAEFLKYVPIALASLREVAGGLPGLEQFSALLAGLPA
jgi:aminoglycoside/choline kinase family phosphotransferase